MSTQNFVWKELMKQQTKALLVSVTVLATNLFIQPSIALALEVHVTDQGAVLFYHDGVLGDTTDKTSEGRAARPAARVAPTTGNKVRLENEKNAIRVKVTNDAGQTPASIRGSEMTIEETEAKRLRAQFPTEVDETKLQRIELENAQQRIKNARSGADGDDPTEAKSIEEYNRFLLQERTDRTDKMEVFSRLDDNGNQVLELQSGSARAALRNADFAFDADTNSVTITTPSGEEKTLNHLPDQALERIRASIVIQNTSRSNPDFAVETADNGKVYYHTQGVQRKKFLGLFNRDITTDVLLNDETGEVETIERQSPGILGQFLDAFTL